MDPSLISVAVVMAHVGLILVAGVSYLRRARVDRPPVGVFNGRDVLVVAVALVVIPPLYLAVPVLALAAVLAVLSTAMLHFSLSPLLGGRRASRVAVVLVVLDIVVAEISRADAEWLFLLVNNLALGIVVVGVCNIWAQSGIRAAHVALLACGLAVYDAIATVALPLMEDFVNRLQSVPLTPMLVWGHESGQVGIGLGDLLLVLVWTLVAERAFSRRAGLLAAALGASCVSGLLLAFWLDLVNRPLPAMVVLGPAIGLHYVVLARRTKHQRTTGEYFASLKNPATAPQAAAIARPALPLGTAGAGSRP
ncbi:MAG: hypothetical protein M3203_03050 [Actinomycetota bacterium]|nr:hypothetical protein [Actinomycetota bacterium]